MKPTLGNFMAALRKEKGLTQRELSEMLCVSDKTVSHWERDETSPDISLLPLIAEIFGITVDELLRGEKNQKEKFSQPPVDEEGKSRNDSILYALDIAFNRFRTRNFISIGLSVIAMLCGLITDYFKAITAGYLVFTAVLTVPLLLTALFRGGFNSALVSPYADRELLKDYGKRANRITLCSLYFSLFCFVLYSSRVVLFHTADLVLVLLVFLASGAAVYLCERVLRRKDLLSRDGEPLIIRKATLMKAFSCLLCAVLLFTVYVSHISKDPETIMISSAEYTFVAAEDFIPLMEKSVPAPEEIYGTNNSRWNLTAELLPADAGTEYTFYTEFGGDSTAIETLYTDGDGEITFTYNNLEIARYRYHADGSFAVYTHAQLIEAGEKAESSFTVHTVIHLILYPVSVLISVGIYFLLKRLFLRENKSKTVTLKLF